MSQGFAVIEGDCLASLREMPDGSVDAVVTDPPYELSDGSKASASRVFLELVLPQEANLKADPLRGHELSFLVEEILRLGHVGSEPRPAAAVEVGAVALDGDVPSGQDDVEDVSVGAVGEPQGHGRAHVKAEDAKYLGCFAFKCADPAALLNALNRSGCGFAAGGVGVGFRVPPSSLPGFLRGCGVIDGSNVDVGALDDALAVRVGALGRAEDDAVACLRLSGGAVETLSAPAALVLLATLKAGGAQLVRAPARARGLSSVLETRRVSIVAPSTGRAVAIDLLLHPVNISETGFMGKAWDGSKIAYDVRLWREVLRVLKPGGHLLAFGGCRTYHRMACAIEDAGFEIRDSVHWLYSTGFPKNLNVSKAIDKSAGAERKVVGSKLGLPGYRSGDQRPSAILSGGVDGSLNNGSAKLAITAPATDAARKWEGFGSALKPSHEPCVLARKPLAGTLAENVQAHGTGALNIDGCRIGAGTGGEKPEYRANFKNGVYGKGLDGGAWENTSGRWPSNLLLSHSPDCERVGTKRVKSGDGKDWSQEKTHGTGNGATYFGKKPTGQHYGLETVDAYRCAPGCPVRELDAQSGNRPGFSGGGIRRRSTGSGYRLPIGNDGEASQTYNDTGGASRFFATFQPVPSDYVPFKYVAKPSRRERNDGVVRNLHNTVKPVALMRYLVRLVTPPGGLVLDPFCGSGTTGIAALKEGMRFLGLEKEPAHVKIATARLAKARFGVASLSQRAMFG